MSDGGKDRLKLAEDNWSLEMTSCSFSCSPFISRTKFILEFIAFHMTGLCQDGHPASNSLPNQMCRSVKLWGPLMGFTKSCTTIAVNICLQKRLTTFCDL